MLPYTPFFHLPNAEGLIRSITEESPIRRDQAFAYYVLADYLLYQARMVRKLAEHPEMIADFVETRGERVRTIIAEKNPTTLEEVLRLCSIAHAQNLVTFSMMKGDHSPKLPVGKLFSLGRLKVGMIAPEIEHKSAFPTVYVLDAQGMIRYIDVRNHDLDVAIDHLLNKVSHSRTHRLSHRSKLRRED